MAVKSPYESAYQDWAKRASRYQAAGIPTSVYLPIVSRDLQRVRDQGSTTMTNQEADTAIFAAWKQYNPITGPQPTPQHHHSLFGELGAALSDVGGIITGAPRGVAHLAKELVTPSTYTKAGEAIAQGVHDIGDPGKVLRDWQSSQLLDLIPGVDVAAKLTTAQGRTSLEEHPVSALLDVLPVTKPLAAVSGAELAARGAGELSDVARATSLGGKIRGKADVRATDPSALAALAAGRPVQALTRALDRSLTNRIPGSTETVARAREAGLGVGQYATRRALAKANLDQIGRNASKVLYQGQTAAETEIAQFSAGQLASMFKELGSDTRRGWQPDMGAIEAFTQKATLGDTLSMTPEEAAVYDRLMSHRAREQTARVEAGELVNVPGYGHYNPNSAVVKTWKKMHTARTNLGRKTRLAEEARSRAVRATARRGGPLIADWAETQRTVQSRHAAAVTNREAARKTLQQRAAAFDRAIIAEPPAHLQPWIKTTMAQRAAEAARTKTPANVDRIGDLRALGDVTAAFKYATETPMMMNRLEKFLGTEEFTRLRNDTITEAIARQRDGFAPLYIHHISPAEHEHPAEVSIARVRDEKESQLQQKLLDGNTSVMNLWVAMTKEAVESSERRNMQRAWDVGFAPHTKTTEELQPIYQAAFDRIRARGRNRPGQTWASLLGKEWVKVDFDRYGISHTGRVGKESDTWLPAELAHNLEVAAGQYRGSGLFTNPIYRGGTKIFRLSVLYGPRHWAHVVIGGVMPTLLDHPSAMLEIPSVWRIAHDAARGMPFTGEVRGEPIPPGMTTPFDYRHDFATKHMNTAVGQTTGRLLKDFWEKTGAVPGDKLAQWERSAQIMYQLANFSRDLRKGVNPIQAGEHARRLVVNLDEMAPFERTIFKQIMPFYSFTRFATLFLARLPFDHPLRVEVLSRLSNQTQEEWGTGLPQTMMSLFYFGHPNQAGNQWTVNLRNMNPFRSLSNTFTLTGFLSSLNPMLSAPFEAAGFNPLKGAQLYPEVTFDPKTGSLVAAQPKGGLWTGAEAFVPELGVVDALTGQSDTFRSLLASGDHQAAWREFATLMNIPFVPSSYNIPQTRGRVAEDALKGAVTAVSQYKKTGDFEGTIGKFALIPYQGRLVTPQTFAQFWEHEQAWARQRYPGAATSAVIPKLTSTTNNALAELLSYYGGVQ